MGTTAITRSGGLMRIQFDFTVEDLGAPLSDIATLRVQILRGTTVLRTLADIAHLSLSLGSSYYTVVGEDPARTGSNNYSLRIFNLSTSDMSVIIENVSTFALETKK
jgi:hypothetical protein